MSPDRFRISLEGHRMLLQVLLISLKCLRISLEELKMSLKRQSVTRRTIHDLGSKPISYDKYLTIL